MSDLEDYLVESLRLDRTLAEIAEDNDRLVLALKAAALENDHLRAALANRLIIGQAQGLLMERLDVDACQAFDYLKRASMHLNRRLVCISEDIVRTRELPTLR